MPGAARARNIQSRTFPSKNEPAAEPTNSTSYEATSPGRTSTTGSKPKKKF
jgi:hypothetical protein